MKMVSERQEAEVGVRRKSVQNKEVVEKKSLSATSATLTRRCVRFIYSRLNLVRPHLVRRKPIFVGQRCIDLKDDQYEKIL